MDYCRACGAEIYWMKTKNDKMMPMNFNEIKQPHWVTCPKASEFRKKGNKK